MKPEFGITGAPGSRQGTHTACNPTYVYAARHLEEGKPHLSLEISHYCNLSCLHCYSACGPDASSPSDLSTGDWLACRRKRRYARVGPGCSLWSPTRQRIAQYGE